MTRRSGKRRRKRVTGFVVYSPAMAKTYNLGVRHQHAWTLTGKHARQIASSGGYVTSWERPDAVPGDNGTASWGVRAAALVMDAAEAVACRMVVGDHKGCSDVVVLDAQTLEQVDSADWVPRTPSQAVGRFAALAKRPR